VSFTLVDAEARRRAREDHGTSFVIAAGAGTGKTTLLVDRIEALVRSGRARLEEIAAVTFTEIAATTMKLRLRERLEAARAEAPAAESERAGRALDVLERAQVSTIHALCAAILQERPLECGVVPGFRVADEAEMDRFFAAAWEEWLALRLTGGDTDDAVRDALDAGIPLEGFFAWGERTSLRGLARQLIDQRDLEPLVAEAAEDPSLFRDELLAQADRARALLGSVQPGDTLGERLRALVELADAVRGLTGRALVARLGDVPSIQRNYGFQKRWASAEALGAGRAIAVWTE
jgi:ATP-dependent helicase/nuclease subunit A